MTSTKKKTYLAVMLISTGALFIDGFVLSSDLAAGGTTAKGLSGPLDVPSNVAQLAIPELPFPRGITPIDPNAEIKDLFAPPMLGASNDTDSSDADKLTVALNRLSAPGHLNSAEFAAVHNLDGVMLDQRLKIASIDGRWTRIGTSIDGCELFEISPREATFKCFDGQVVLSLDLLATDPAR